MKPILVLCLGNEILSDDSFGFHVSKSLKKMNGDFGSSVEVTFAPLAGFSLIDYLQGRKSVLVIDTIITGKVPPGTLHCFSMDEMMPSRSLTMSHEISLPTAVKLARLMGLEGPENIDILAVEAQDVETLSEKMTDPIRAAIAETVEYISGWIKAKNQESNSYGERIKKIAAP